MSLTRPSLDAYAALKDFIADPSGHGLPFARRMALRMTARIPDVERAGNVNADLNAALDVLVHTCALIPDLASIDAAQEHARRVLEVCRKLGRQ